MLIDELINKIQDLDDKFSGLYKLLVDNETSDYSKSMKFSLEVQKEMGQIENIIYGLTLFFEKVPNLKDNFVKLRQCYIENFLPKKEDKINEEQPTQNKQ